MSVLPFWTRDPKAVFSHKSLLLGKLPGLPVTTPVPLGALTPEDFPANVQTLLPPLQLGAEQASPANGQVGAPPDLCLSCLSPLGPLFHTALALEIQLASPPSLSSPPLAGANPCSHHVPLA